MKRFLVILFLICFSSVLQANSVRLINNSPYNLRAVVRGSDGSFLGEFIVNTQDETSWVDTSGQYGSMGGANARAGQAYRSKTPYTVLWYCMDGSDYAMCDTVSTGAVVTAQSCSGAKMCKTEKREMYPYQPQDNYYPRQPEGNFLYTPPPPPEQPVPPPSAPKAP